MPRWFVNATMLVGLVLVVACGSGESGSTVQIQAVGGEESSAPAPGGAPASTSPSAPTPRPTPGPPRSLFATHQVVAYYGNPLSATMGILGEYQGDELIRRVKAQGQRYQELNPDKTIMPALHLVYAVAQAAPGPDGTYLLHMPDEMVEGFIEQTRANNMIFFIDLQNGRADPVAEVQKVLKWLRHEHVHLAVDPEFTLGPGENTKDDIGSLDGTTINKIQDLLQAVALEAGISNKILVIHQFQADMITNKNLIADRDRVDVVIDMDGWGGPTGKVSKYQAFVANQLVEYAGIKLFYRWDKPMMTEAEVQGLTPRPHYIMYQ